MRDYLRKETRKVVVVVLLVVDNSDTLVHVVVGPNVGRSIGHGRECKTSRPTKNRLTNKATSEVAFTGLELTKDAITDKLTLNSHLSEKSNDLIQKSDRDATFFLKENYFTIIRKAIFYDFFQYSRECIFTLSRFILPYFS